MRDLFLYFLFFDRLYNHTHACVCHTAFVCNKGSSENCTATPLDAPGYSAGTVVRISGGLPVAKTSDNNSCPVGYKIWSPRNKDDYDIVWNALGKNESNFPKKDFAIVDVTKAADNACTTCSGPMRSSNAKQSEWRTSDGSAWWLRDTAQKAPINSYTGNCYMSLKKVDPSDVQLDAAWCNVSSTDYLCQPIDACTCRVEACVCGW